MNKSFLLHIIFIGMALVLPAAVASARDTRGSQPKPSEGSIKHVDAKQALKLVAQKQVVVLDIRTPEEFKVMHIAGATNINFRAADFEQRISSLARTNAYLVH